LQEGGNGPRTDNSAPGRNDEWLAWRGWRGNCGQRGQGGAEGFEASFPSGHYTIFFVGFNGKISLYPGLARILQLARLSQFSYRLTEFRKNLVSLVSSPLDVQPELERTPSRQVYHGAGLPRSLLGGPPLMFEESTNGGRAVSGSNRNFTDLQVVGVELGKPTFVWEGGWTNIGGLSCWPAIDALLIARLLALLSGLHQCLPSWGDF